MEIRLEEGHWIMGEYTIAGDEEDGYVIWRTDDYDEVEDFAEALFESKSFEECVTWCWNS